MSRVAVWRQQAADNLQETDKLDIYTEITEQGVSNNSTQATRLMERFSEECVLGSLSDRNTFFLIVITLVVAFFFSREAVKTFLFVFP